MRLNFNPNLQHCICRLFSIAYASLFPFLSRLTRGKREHGFCSFRSVCEEGILAGSVYAKLASSLKNMKSVSSSSIDSCFQILIKLVDKV